MVRRGRAGSDRDFRSYVRWNYVDTRIQRTSSRQVERRNNNPKRSRSSRAKSRECFTDTGISCARIRANGLARGTLSLARPM
jgi:hypothetical protein